jgi:MtN3 and saliva related transmembrane protein
VLAGCGFDEGAHVTRDFSKRMLTCGVIVLSAMVLSGCESLAIPDTSSLFFPGLQKSEVFGFVAGFGTTFAAVPDLIRMVRRQSSKGINPTMASIIGMFQIVWIYYGLLIVSRPVIVWNLLGVIINFLTVGAYLRFARRETQRATE